MGNIVSNIKINCLPMDCLWDRTNWNSKFPYILWNIWKAHYDLVFNGKFKPVTKVVKMTTGLVEEAGMLLRNTSVVVGGNIRWVG